jgi:predicted dienelactone hydrolase
MAVGTSSMRLSSLALVSTLTLSVTMVCSCAPESTREELPFAPASKDAAPDPSQAGPYPVGVRHFDLVDDLRTEASGPHEGKPRTLPLEVWYPARESARAEEQEDLLLFDELPPDLQEGLSPDDLGRLSTIAVRDAAVRADDDDQYPLVVFSHGKGGTRVQSTFYTAYLASHGYIVAAPDHSGDTIVELLREVKTEGAIRPDSTVQALVDRPDDIVAVIDLLGDIVDDDLRSRIDEEHIGVTGHSFGAITSFLAAGKDNRIDAIVPQCPSTSGLLGLQLETPLEEMQTQMHIQSAGLDRTLPEDGNARQLYGAMPTPKSWLSLARAGHFTFSDLCVLDVEAINAVLGLDVSNVLDDGCGPEALSTDIAFPIIRNHAIGFFNLTLRGSAPSKRFLSQDLVDKLAPGEGTFREDDGP